MCAKKWEYLNFYFLLSTLKISLKYFINDICTYYIGDKQLHKIVSIIL